MNTPNFYFASRDPRPAQPAQRAAAPAAGHTLSAPHRPRTSSDVVPRLFDLTGGPDELTEDDLISTHTAPHPDS